MKIGEFGWMPGNSIESTKLTAASNRFQAFFQSLAKSDTVVPVQLPEKVSDGAVSKASLQDLFKVLSNNNVEKLEAVSSTADLEGEKADPINIIHAILNKWDLDSELNENTLHQMAEKVERAFSTVEKQLFHFIHSFSFDEPTENMFAETSLPDLVHALKGIQLAGAETSLLQSQHKVNETVDALANLVSQLINQTGMAAESHENSSNADTAADSMREKNPIMQKLDQSEIEGDIHQKTNETITTKENGAVIATSAKAQAEIAPDSVLATKKETEQTLSPKTNESTASKFVTDKVEQTNQTTADILMQNNDYLLKNGEIIAEDNFFYNSIFLSNEELAGQADEDALANQKKINTITGENKHAFLSIQSGQQQKNVSIMEENISDLEFEKELNKINSDLLSSLQTENRISPQMTAPESIKKSADSHAESVQNKNGKESGLHANAFSTDFVENSGLNEKIIHGDKMAEQLGKALDSKTDQGKTQIEHGRDTLPDTMFLDEAHSVLESSFNLNEKNQPISKKHLGLINQLPNQGEINNTSNLFVSTPSEKPEENSGILMDAFNRKADSRLVQEQEEKAPNPLAANPFGKIGTNERTFMPEGTGRGNQSEQRPKFIQETNPLIQEQEEKASTPLAANSFGKIGTNERTFMPEGTGRGNQSEQRPKFIQETNPLIQEQEEKGPNRLAANSFGKIGTDERTFMSEGTGHPIEEILKFSQDTSQLAQQNKEYANGLGKIRRDQSVRTMEAHAEMKNLSNANESAHRITPLFEQLQQVTEGKAFNRFRSQFANTNFASQAANSEKNSNKTTLLQETPTSSSGIIRQTNGMNITENTEQELPIHAGTKINEAASLQPNLQSNPKEAMPLNQTMALDTVQLINPLLYQTSSQMAERRANEHNKDAVMANGSQARANAIIDEAAINSGQIMHSGQSINPFHYKTFVGRADTQLKISSQAVKPAEAATEGEETPFQLNNIKSLVSSIVDKLNTAAKKEEKPNAMFAKMVNPLMIGSIKKTNDVESVRMESIKPLVEKNETDAKTIVVGQMQTAISAKQEPLVLLTASGNPVSAHQLREQLEKVLSNGKFVNNGDNQTFTLRLAPDHLGSIKIEIYQKEGNISAKIFTASQEAKDVLETHLTSIKHTLGSQNAVVDKLDISYTPSPQDKTAKDNQQHQQQQQEQQQKEEQPSQQKEREKQRKTFLEELLNME